MHNQLADTRARTAVAAAYLTLLERGHTVVFDEYGRGIVNGSAVRLFVREARQGRGRIALHVGETGELRKPFPEPREGFDVRRIADAVEELVRDVGALEQRRADYAEQARRDQAHLEALREVLDLPPSAAVNRHGPDAYELRIGALTENDLAVLITTLRERLADRALELIEAVQA